MKHCLVGRRVAGVSASACMVGGNSPSKEGVESIRVPGYVHATWNAAAESAEPLPPPGPLRKSRDCFDLVCMHVLDMYM